MSNKMGDDFMWENEGKVMGGYIGFGRFKSSGVNNFLLFRI